MPFIKRFYIIRYPKLFYIQQDFWSHVYGILGVIGLAITIIFTYSAYKNVGSESAKIINAISFSLITITIAFVFVSAYYVRKLSMNRVELEETRIIKEKLRKQFLLNRYQSEAFHNITHYHRNINARLYQFFENPDGYTGEDMKELANRFDEYMIILSSNIQNYFSFVTNDNCSVTLKLIDSSKEYVNTFFRDPVNFNKRRKSDKNGRYKIIENTGFELIVSEKFTNIYYYDDDLKNVEERGYYKNSNADWSKLYNATIVVPISMVIDNNKRDILGFITVDNMNGGLSNDVNAEFLLGIGDILYNIFIKYKEFATITQKKGVEHERIKAIQVGT